MYNQNTLDMHLQPLSLTDLKVAHITFIISSYCAGPSNLLCSTLEDERNEKEEQIVGNIWIFRINNIFKWHIYLNYIKCFLILVKKNSEKSSCGIVNLPKIVKMKPSKLVKNYQSFSFFSGVHFQNFLLKGSFHFR